MWEQINLGCYTISEILEIIEDALCHLFEFKVENGNIYFREMI